METNDSPSYQLSPGLLSYCQGTWNPEKNIYESDNSIGVIQCCLDSCAEKVNYCLETSGMGACREIISSCRDNCLRYPSQGLSIINTCATDSSCGTYPLYDKDCLKDNRDTIIKCCKEQCIPNQSDDCNSSCPLFFNSLINELEIPSAQPAVATGSIKEKFMVFKKGFKMVYLLFLILLFIIWLIL